MHSDDNEKFNGSGQNLLQSVSYLSRKVVISLNPSLDFMVGKIWGPLLYLGRKKGSIALPMLLKPGQSLNPCPLVLGVIPDKGRF